jgi:dephospho-CoA kinase
VAVPFVGLTGGLGAGKSTALELLAQLGAATLSTDAVVHELLATDELRRLVAERFGPEVVPEGALDRSLIAKRVFADGEARAWLEGVLWPRVGERVATWRAELERADPPPRAAVVEVPLLFESGMESVFDATIAVVAEESVRERRAAARGHASVAERAGRQLPQDEKAARADYTVRNDAGVEALRSALAAVLERLDAQFA